MASTSDSDSKVWLTRPVYLPPGAMYRPLGYLKEDQVEPVEEYVQGGYHPLDLGDVLDGRYEVFDKLGFGGQSTVWLCLDTMPEIPEWCTVKVMQASRSSETCAELKIMELLHDADLSNSHIQLPHASFWIEGPNGRHLCLVLPVLGPSISEAAKEDVAFQKDILFKAAESLQFLHDRGICHGDFRPANILLLIPSLQGMERNAMRKLLGKSETEPVIVLDEKASHRVPRRWVEKKQIRARPFNRIAVIDFGVHFQISKPLNQAFIPRQYVSPEAWLGLEIGPSMDLWSFACTILEVRNTGGGFGGERYEDIAGNLELYLGPMPEPYRSIYMKRISEDPPKWYTPGEDGPVSSTLEDLEESRAKSLKYWGGHNELFEACIGSVRQVWEYPLDAEGCEDLSQEPTMVEYKVPDDEVPVLADLVRRSFKWHVSERLDLAGMMNHEWFDGRQSKELAKKTKNLGAAEPLVRWFRKHATTLAMSAVLTGLFLGFSIWKGAPGARSSRMSAFRGLLHGLTRWKL